MTEPAKPLSIFLIYSRVDSSSVHKLYKYLCDKGYDVWLDKKIKPGQDWGLEINRMLSRSDVAIVCLSQAAVSKDGNFHVDIRLAHNRAQKMPEGNIFLIPVRLDNCEVPNSLNKFQWVDLLQKKDYPHLITALEQCAKQLRRAPIVVPRVLKRDIDYRQELNPNGPKPVPQEANKGRNEQGNAERRQHLRFAYTKIWARLKTPRYLLRGLLLVMVSSFVFWLASMWIIPPIPTSTPTSEIFATEAPMVTFTLLPTKTLSPTPEIQVTETPTLTLTSPPTETLPPTHTALVTKAQVIILVASPTETLHPTPTVFVTDTPVLTLTSSPTETISIPTPGPADVWVHIQGAGFEFTGLGGWVVMKNQNTVYSSQDSNAIYTRTRTVGYTNDADWVKWHFGAPATGYYRVCVFAPSYSHSSGITNQARYTIHHANGDSVTIQQQSNMSGNWMDLGRYQFNQGTDGYIYMGDYTGNNPWQLISADAAKFRWSPSGGEICQ